MTNIAAFKARLKKGRKKVEHVFFVTEGMGSTPRFVIKDGQPVPVRGGGTKTDRNQKLFKIGSHLIAGTGRGDYIQHTAKTLLKDNYDTTEEVGERILDISSRLDLDPNDGLEFVVGGPQDKGVALLSVMPQRKNGKKDIRIKEHMSISTGSGSRFVDDYIEGLKKAGKPVPLNDLAQALVLLYEFANEGATDSGVNDKLQFGISNNDGASTLYHPSIRLLPEFYVDHLSSMTGVPVLRKRRKLKEKQQRQQLCDAFAVLDSFYVALESDLRDLASARLQSTFLCEAWQNGSGSLADATKAKKLRDRAKRFALKGAQALEARGMQGLIDYHRNYQERLTKVHNRALAYVRQS